MDIEKFHKDPKCFNDPEPLIDQIEKQIVEITYRITNEDFGIARIKSEFVQELSKRVTEILDEKIKQEVIPSKPYPLEEEKVITSYETPKYGS